MVAVGAVEEGRAAVGMVVEATEERAEEEAPGWEAGWAAEDWEEEEAREEEAKREGGWVMVAAVQGVVAVATVTEVWAEKATLAAGCKKTSPSELLASPSELLASPSELLASPSEL
jgi:hypothetical protein